MKVRFWGVRGSIPVPGRQTNRYGGNTSCVEVKPRGADPIIIDAGTGIRKLGQELMTREYGEGRGTAQPAARCRRQRGGSDEENPRSHRRF